MSAFVASYGGPDLTVKRRDKPFGSGILCFFLEESIRKQKVPKR
jgi:hypothetical protein